MVGVAVMFGDPHMLRRERVLVVVAVLVAHSPALSAGTAVVENLAVPRYEPDCAVHVEMAERSPQITQRGAGPAA